MRRKVLGQMVLAKESFLAHAALVRLDAGVAHLVPPHIRTIRKFHIAHITFEELSLCRAGAVAVRRLLAVLQNTVRAENIEQNTVSRIGPSGWGARFHWKSVVLAKPTRWHRYSGVASRMTWPPLPSPWSSASCRFRCHSPDWTHRLRIVD